jgi:hypothetical protein
MPRARKAKLGVHEAQTLRSKLELLKSTFQNSRTAFEKANVNELKDILKDCQSAQENEIRFQNVDCELHITGKKDELRQRIKKFLAIEYSDSTGGLNTQARRGPKVNQIQNAERADNRLLRMMTDMYAIFHDDAFFLADEEYLNFENGQDITIKGKTANRYTRYRASQTPEVQAADAEAARDAEGSFQQNDNDPQLPEDASQQPEDDSQQAQDGSQPEQDQDDPQQVQDDSPPPL